MEQGVKSREPQNTWGELMRKKLFGFGLALSVLLFALSVSAQAQQPKKVPRIGYLSIADPAGESTRAEAIRRALRELGHIEGQNIAIEYRYTKGKRDRAPELAADWCASRLILWW